MKKVSSAFVCFLLLFCCSALAAAEVEVRFKSEAKVSGQDLTLQEVASLSPQEAKQKHGDEVLFPAPDSGEGEVFEAATLKAYVREALSDERQVSWSGADKVVVRREGRLIREQEIKEMIQQYMKGKSRELPVNELRFTPSSLPDPFTVPRGDLDYQVIPSHSQVIGSRYLTLRIWVDEQMVTNKTIRGDLEAKAEVVVAKKDLDRDQVLGEEDIKLQERDITGTRDPFTSKGEVAGMHLKRGMESGQVLRERDVTRPVLVDRGEVVTMVAQSDSLRVTAKGVARSKGKKGDVIKVRNTQSQEEVLCRVVQNGRVKVEF